MKQLGNIFVVVGLVVVVFGFGALMCPILRPLPHVQEAVPRDPDGAWQLVVIAQKYVIGIGGGMLMIAVGGYIRSFKTRKSDERSPR
jgi:hypothetical protein